eukprot:5299326-Pleurochrysis_carterae.AAC.3
MTTCTSTRSHGKNKARGGEVPVSKAGKAIFKCSNPVPAQEARSHISHITGYTCNLQYFVRG